MTFGRDDLGKFESVRVATLRTAQLTRGCTPRVAIGGNFAATACREVACGKVVSLPRRIASTVAAPEV